MGRFWLAGYERFAGTRKEELHVLYGGQQERAELHPVTVELAQGPNFGTITTVLPSGNLHTQYIWVGTDGERVVVNTEVHRQKYKNVERDPRVTLTTLDEQNPYRYAEVRGQVVETVGGQEARDHIDELSQKYTGRDYPPGNIVSERVNAVDRPG